MKVTEIERYKARRCDTHAMSFFQFLSLSHGERLVGLNEMRTRASTSGATSEDFHGTVLAEGKWRASHVP